MQNCQFYFLINAYFRDFPDPCLMKGDTVIGDVHDRPFFFAFPDLRQPKVFWLVPVSSKYKKYRAIYKKEVAKHGQCKTLAFGKFRGKVSTFLLQNMCPATEDYLSPYLDKYGNPAVIDSLLAKRISSKGRAVLALSKRGYKVIFPKSLQIYKKLLRKIEAEEKAKAKEKKKAQSSNNQSQDQGQPAGESQDVAASIGAPASLTASPKGGEGQS